MEEVGIDTSRYLLPILHQEYINIANLLHSLAGKGVLYTQYGSPAKM